MRILTSSACLLWGVVGATAVGQGCQPAGGPAGDGPGGHFPSGYREAREKFLEASRAAGAVVESIRNPHTGPDGEEFFIDVSLVGPGNAKSVLLLISGTHGVEGFAGSAIQTGLLREWVAEARVLAAGLAPFLPSTAARIEASLGGDSIEVGEPLFPRLE